MQGASGRQPGFCPKDTGSVFDFTIKNSSGTLINLSAFPIYKPSVIINGSGTLVGATLNVREEGLIPVTSSLGIMQVDTEMPKWYIDVSSRDVGQSTVMVETDDYVYININDPLVTTYTTP